MTLQGYCISQQQMLQTVNSLDYSQLIALIIIAIEAFLTIAPTKKNYTLLRLLIKALTIFHNKLPNRAGNHERHKLESWSIQEDKGVYNA